MLPSIHESGTSPDVPSKLLTVDTSVAQNNGKQGLSPHTVGEEKAKARARGWSMVAEDAEKAKREIAWNRYRRLAQDITRQDGDAGSDQEGAESPLNVLKNTLLTVLQEAEQLSNEHYTLQHNEKELQMNLKIARSNLQLAEMNSEMLEEALRRGGEGFAGRMLPLPSHNASMTSIDTVRTDGSRPTTPSVGTSTTISRTSVETSSRPASNVGGARSTAMTIPFSGGGSAAAAMIPPQIVRRRSSSEGGPSVRSTTAAQKIPGSGATTIPQPARPAMERSNTLGSSAVPAPSTSAGSGIGSFFRKNFDKRSSAFMQDLGLQNLKMPDLQSLPIPSPSAATRAEFFSSLGMSNAGATSSSPNLAIPNGFTSSSPSTAAPGTSISRSPLSQRGGWYDAVADMGGASDAEVQKLRASLVATHKSVKSLKDELGAMKKAKAELEAELETLSQALFEEANKMVADERKKRAEKEEEAKEAIEEREALRKVVKLMEAEKAAGRGSVQADSMALNDLGKGIPDLQLDTTDNMSRPETDGQRRHVPGGFPLSAGSEPWTDKDAALDATTRSIDEPPKRSTAEELEELMKRMEADFGKL
ncbi:hypothetical protein QFC19_001388 [Naganishia cerealis]|uniref:Uncharacterized protein n=1 Tax=Naganishia cerealis TaxID=610337 RepID=A0ACC2WI68_9TREE|nr:hypothetical protein QFC19_001388 [Naganishia cerealis]